MERFKEVPPALAARPSLSRDQRFYLDSYLYLMPSRPQGFSGPGKLQFDTMTRYAEIVGYRGEDILFFVDVMMACDTAFFAYLDKTKPSREAEQLDQQKRMAAVNRKR